MGVKVSLSPGKRRCVWGPMQRRRPFHCQRIQQEKMDHHQLVKDCLRGDGAAQKQLYEHFAGAMLGVCYRYTKSMVDAEDVLQEGFIMVFRNLHKFSFSDDGPEVSLNTKELAELIRQLPPGYQAIFNLHAIEGYSHVEIGKILGIKEGTSRSQYARARALLISWINKISAVNKNENSYARPKV